MSNAFNEQKKLFEKSMDDIKLFKKENVSLGQRLKFLETKLEDQDQIDKLINVVIIGVPKQDDPCTANIVSSIFSSLQGNLEKGDLKNCYRLNIQANGPILAKFNKQQTKKEIIMKVRHLKGITVGKWRL